MNPDMLFTIQTGLEIVTNNTRPGYGPASQMHAVVAELLLFAAGFPADAPPEIVADWWEEHGSHESARFLRGLR